MIHLFYLFLRLSLLALISFFQHINKVHQQKTVCHMLSFQQQQKIVNQILKRPSNQQCADCNTISPTWASLDFGVFLCSNCSGAHRALGPQTTRVRSTKLDKWDAEWFNNMQIGNKELNQFWEFKVTALTKKPKLGASLDEVNRYVFDKYVKRKYAAEGEHPLKLYKQNKYTKTKLSVPTSLKTVKTDKTKNDSDVPVKKEVQDLLNFEQQHHGKPRSVGGCLQQKKIIEEQQQEDFGVFTDAATENSNSHTTKQMTFQQLMNLEKTKSNQKIQAGMMNGNMHMNHVNQYQGNFQMNQYNQHINPRNNGMYHSLSHNEGQSNQVGQPGQYPWMNHNHYYHHQNTMGIQGSLPINAKYPGDFTPVHVQNSTYPWMLHNHHYHHQNTEGIQGKLPINAKYPGNFTPINLQTTHTQKKPVEVSSWADGWK